MALGTVFNIQKFSVNDGPGIRTTVFLKGCPLRCLWCHNPESHKSRPEIFYNPEKCIGCGACAVACPAGAHSFSDGTHRFERSLCNSCGACASVCPILALETAGKKMTPAEVMEAVMSDKVFYETSGGGITLSGGEPMAQLDFTIELLTLAKAEGLHTAMETSGFAKSEDFERVAPLVDLFLFDYKETCPRRHKEYTGVSMAPIRKNLALLDSLGKDIILRCPIIPGLNAREGHFKGIAKCAEAHASIREIHILPYHPLGESKSEQLGREYPLSGVGFPSEEECETWISRVRAHTEKPVKRG